MLVSLRRLIVPLALVLVLALTACGGRQAAAPTATPEPTEAPTRTPRPTREPTATPEPTEEATEAPTEASSTGSTGELLPVEIGTLQKYDHPSGVFSIEVPENWSVQDNSKADEIIMIWTDPTRNGGVIVDIFEDTTTYTADQLTDILKTFLNNSFGTQPDFSIDDPVTQNDGSVLLVWTYTATADNDVQAPLLGNSFIEQRGNKVSILTTLVPDDQFDTLKDKTDEIINTYSIDPEATLVTSN